MKLGGSKEHINSIFCYISSKSTLSKYWCIWRVLRAFASPLSFAKVPSSGGIGLRSKLGLREYHDAVQYHSYCVDLRYPPECAELQDLQVVFWPLFRRPRNLDQVLFHEARSDIEANVIWRLLQSLLRPKLVRPQPKQ